MNRHRYVLIVFFVSLFGNKCLAQAAGNEDIARSVMKCWRAISHEYSDIYGLEEDEIKRYSQQKICLTSDSVRTYYGVSYTPKYSVKKVNAEAYAKSNFDCSKQKLGITTDSVFEITILSITRPNKAGQEHKMTNIVAYDGNCLYVVMDGVIFKMVDADAKIQRRISN